MAYCQWLLQEHTGDVALVTQMLVTDNAGFVQDAVFTTTCHLWAESNAHAHHLANHQHQFSINVWARIIWDDL
jgi:hypothetical protein